MKNCFDENSKDENRDDDVINKYSKNRYKRNVIINIKERIKKRVNGRMKIKEIIWKIWFVSEMEKYLLTLPLVV